MSDKVITIATEKWVEENKNKIFIEDRIMKEDIRGVYSFWVDDECVYVGKGINIRSRVYEHLNGVKWKYFNIKMKECPEHIEVLSDAFKNGKKIYVKVEDEVEYKYDNYYRDLHRLAYCEYRHIEEYQEKGWCLHQSPEGSFNNAEYEGWLEHSNNI